MSRWLCFSRKGLMLGVACGLVSLALMGGEARAGILQITISEGATSYVILDEGPLDTLVAPPPDNVNKIQALAAALVFPDYKIIGLNASTNNPGVADPSVGATLIVGGEVQKLTSGAAPPLIITVTDTDYNQPGNPREMQSISSTQFTGEPVGTKTFQSWYNPNNTLYAKQIPQGALPQSYSSTGTALNGLTQTSGLLPVPPAALYGLTNETVITMGTVGGDLVFGGSTTITSVIPEPASMSLLALGLPLTVWTLIRRRRA
jgi:hypothetical protein